MDKQLENTVKRLSWMAVLLVMAALIISAVEYKRNSRVMDMGVTIDPLNEDEYLLTEEDVRTTINRSFGVQLEGLQLAVLDVDRVERVLEQEPFVLDAEVFINAQNKIFVDIYQRKPVLRIIDQNGVSYYLDETGTRLPLSAHYSPRMLVATGNIPPFVPDYQLRKEHLIKDLFELTQMIREDELLTRLIEQVYVDIKGELVLIPKIGRQKILFGKFQNAEQKFRRLKIFYLEGLPYTGWRKYKTINLKYKNQVVAGS